MAVGKGNDLMVWVASPAPTPSYGLVGGQRSLQVAFGRQTADASHKTSGGVALKVPTLLDIAVEIDGVVDLPNASWTLAESAVKAGTPLLVELRKGGAAAAASDAVFRCSMFVLSLNPSAPLNGVQEYTLRFEPEAAPLLNLTLAV